MARPSCGISRSRGLGGGGILTQRWLCSLGARPRVFRLDLRAPVFLFGYSYSHWASLIARDSVTFTPSRKLLSPLAGGGMIRSRPEWYCLQTATVSQHPAVVTGVILPGYSGCLLPPPAEGRAT
jgi:hypothetical protein